MSATVDRIAAHAGGPASAGAGPGGRRVIGGRASRALALAVAMAAAVAALRTRRATLGRAASPGPSSRRWWTSVLAVEYTAATGAPRPRFP